MDPIAPLSAPEVSTAAREESACLPPALDPTRSKLPRLTPSWRMQWVKTREGLAHFLSNLKERVLISLDTETGGDPRLNEPLNAHLALMQIGLPDRDPKTNAILTTGRTVVVDVVDLEKNAPITVGRGDDRSVKHRNPIKPLRKYFGDREHTIVVHHAPFEKEQLSRYGIEMANVVDTKDLSKLVRPDLVSYALNACAAELLEVYLDKGEQASSWLTRPLSEEQVRYAALDAEVTILLYRKVTEMQQQMQIDRSRSSSQLMQDLLVEEDTARGLMRRADVGTRYFTHLYRAHCLEEHLKRYLGQQLAEGQTEVKFKGSYGSASLTGRAKTVLDVAKLRELHPEVAEATIYETAKKKDLRQAMIDFTGFAPAHVDEILQGIWIETGRTKPELKIWPKFESLYGGAVKETKKAFESSLFAAAGVAWPSVTRARDLAEKLRPDLETYSLPALFKEVLGVEIPAEDATAKVIGRGLTLSPEQAQRAARYKQLTDDLVKKLEGMAADPISEPAKIGGADQLLRMILEERSAALSTLREAGIGNEYWVAKGRRREIEAALCEKLFAEIKPGESAIEFTCPAGEAKVGTKPLSVLDSDKLRKKYPEVAKAVLYTTAKKEQIKAALVEKGLAPIDADKLVKEVYQVTGFTQPSFRAFPKYSLIYGRADEAEDQAAEEAGGDTPEEDSE